MPSKKLSKKSFDNELYLKLQSKKILSRINSNSKLYLEFGGKIFDDYHASRVLKGFQIDSKMKVFTTLKDIVEIMIVINAQDIQTNKTRSDVGISYESDVLRLIDYFRKQSLYVGSIVITHYNNQPLANSFRQKLTNLGLATYLHYKIENYPYDVNKVLSDEGFGRNDYIKTTKKLIVVTAPGPGSGKMATCLSQLYLDYKHGISASYSKYETFPVWNLPLRHPINLAYEAATANLSDINMIDYYHYDAYQVQAVNYNRDMEVFPVLKKIFEQIYGSSPYQSPTDMGVNMAGFAIIDEEKAIYDSKQEIIRRYLDAKCQVKLGKVDESVLDKLLLIMNGLSISVDDRQSVKACLEYQKQKRVPVVALELPNGKMITGKRSDLFEATAGCLMNALKYYAKISDDLDLLAKSIIEPIQNLKTKGLKGTHQRLTIIDVLNSLAILATTNPTAELALKQLGKLSGGEMHSSLMLHHEEKRILKKLQINVTTETDQDDLFI